MKKKIGFGVLALLVIGVIIGLLRDPSPEGSQASHDAFSEVASLKDEEGNRIYIFELAPDVSAQTVRSQADGLELTNGFITAAYFYAEDAAIPLHSVNFASTMEQANKVIYETRGLSPWRYAYMRAPEGGVRFVDCQQEPNDELCRK